MFLGFQSKLNNYIGKKCVIYFSPSDIEIEEIANNDTTGEFEIYEAISDFGYYANNVDSILRNNDLSIFYITDEIISFKTQNGTLFKYNRVNPDNAPFGMIVYDGIDSVIVSEYVLTDYGIVKFVNGFFKLSILLDN